MGENRSLRIHTRIQPDPIQPETADQGANTEATGAQSSRRTARHIRRATIRRRSTPATRGDRLLRNSAIACALLLGILSLGNLEAPWAKKASEGIERALTMHIDLDESIGALQFVKSLMPESALVFMNLGDDSRPVRPVVGTVTHVWSDLQPWLMFGCESGSEVHAIQAGTVTAVSRLSDGTEGLLVDHGEGIETLYARLSDAKVQSGDALERGQVLGHAAGDLYFEYRRGGEPSDPTEMLGL